MGTFTIACRIENVADRRRVVDVPRLLVDTGSEHTWVPAPLLEQIGVGREKKDLQFITATGQTITRSVGFGVIHVQGTHTVDELVFGEPGDLTLLGARTLEGLNFTVDAARKRLVGAGPILAAPSITPRCAARGA